MTPQPNTASRKTVARSRELGQPALQQWEMASQRRESVNLSPLQQGRQLQQTSFGTHGWIFPSDSVWTPVSEVDLRRRSSLPAMQRLVLLCHLSSGSERILQDDTRTCEWRQIGLLELFLASNMVIEIGNASRQWDRVKSSAADRPHHYNESLKGKWFL